MDGFFSFSSEYKQSGRKCHSFASCNASGEFLQDSFQFVGTSNRGGFFLYHFKKKDYCHKEISPLQLEKHILKTKYIF